MGKSITEISKQLGVSRPTLYRYLKKGRIRYSQHPLTGRLKINEADIEKLLREIEQQ